MGKCIRRTINKKATSFFMTREGAVSSIFELLNSKSKKSNIKQAQDTISLFGISAEELSEAGMAYENLMALGSILS